MARISVLIVDDEPEFADVLSERLSLRDMDISVAYCGEDALKILEKETFDVILLDVMMPGLGGIETLTAILKQDPDAAVIMLSGHADMNTAMEGMNRGAFYYLVKPVDIEELVYRLEDAKSSGVE